jgi:hypothetical protein
MNYSNKASSPYRIAKCIFENGPMTINRCAELLSDIAEHSMRSTFGRMCCELDLEKTGETFDLQAPVRRHFENLSDAPRELAGPRFAATFKPISDKNKFWTAPRREPIRDIGFKNGGTGFGYGFSL